MIPFSDEATVRRAMRRLGSSLCGRYSITRLIGIGGMAAVYAGVHRNGHAVAIKILHERLATDPEIERLFRREAQLANQVGHPGVVPVIDDDVSEDGCVFLVMPLLRGETLRARAERNARKLPVGEVAVLAHELLVTLAAAHAKKIVHRDIKPENVFVTVGGEIRMLDFGIGRFFEVNEGASATRSGRALGTPAFMAPEQALGRLREVDGRTDLWALGATMFSLLTGRFVHDAETPTELAVLAATRHAPRLGDLAPEVPEPIRAVIDRALSFKKDERWADAEAMDQALLGASLAAFGEPVGELPPLVVPELRPSDEVAGLPTQVPSNDARLGHEGGQDIGEEASNGIRPISSGAEAFRDAPTRTTEIAVAGAGAKGIALGRRELTWGWRSLLLGAGFLGVLSMAALLVHTPRRLLPETAAGASTSQSGRPERETFVSRALSVAEAADSSSAAATDLRSTEGTRADREFAIARHAWEDASVDVAVTHLGAAINADPNYPDAHLLFVLLYNWNDSSVREHFRRAAEARDRLSEGNRLLLDAIRPTMSDELGIEESSKRLTALAAARPDDAFIVYASAMNLIKLGEIDRAVEFLERIPASLSSLNIFIMLRGLAYSLADNLVLARQAYERCAAAVVNPTACLSALVEIDTYEGNCEEAEKIARRLVAVNPKAVEPLGLLGRALYAHHGDLEAARHIFQQRWDRLQAFDAPSVAAERTKLDVLAGDFKAAERDLSAWQQSVATSVDERAHADYTELAALLALERGEDDKAANLANVFARGRAAMIGGSYFDFGILPLRILHLSHRIDDAQYTLGRDQWLREDVAHGPRVGAQAIRWLRAYAQTASSPEEAATALQVLPQYGPFQARSHRPADQDYAIGHTFLLAARLDDASKHLQRGAASCSATDWPLQQTWVYLDLGHAREQAGQQSAACEAYSRVVARWGRAADSRSAHEARSRMSALGCARDQ
jgi:serine/threonine protein kinase/tetratricopeptide (TPR) repeat protein